MQLMLRDYDATSKMYCSADTVILKCGDWRAECEVISQCLVLLVE